MEQQYIDSLFECLLNLTDEYVRLQHRLSELLKGVFEKIARANYLAPPGMRYDLHHFDQRMRALRGLDTTLGKNGVPNFQTKPLGSSAIGKDQKEDEKREDSSDGDKADTTAVQENPEVSPEETQGPEDKGEDEEKQEKKKTKKATDPLLSFGLFPPAPLREAQALSTQTVEQVIPRLASVIAEMDHVEIEIRRAQKKREKAAAAAEKEAARMEAAEAK